MHIKSTLMAAVLLFTAAACASSQQNGPEPAAGPASESEQGRDTDEPGDANDTVPHSFRDGSDGNDAAAAAMAVIPTFDPLYFAFNSDAVQTADETKLQALADYMSEHPDSRVTISGHCDDRGTPEYNLALGDRRANAARTYLRRLGVKADRVHIVSYGSERPALLGEGEEAWARNRRDEFHLAASETALVNPY